MIPVRVDNVAVDESRENFFVILTSEEKDGMLPVSVGAREAVSIATEMNDRPQERPGTHDLLDTLTRELDGEIESVDIKNIGKGSLSTEVHVRD
ncbi:MAG: bifunctional nuclease family protein, partial [bacterium]